MPDYSLGTAHGTIKIDYDGTGVNQAQQGMALTKRSADDLDASMTKVGTGALIAGGLLAAGFALAVNAAANLEQKLSNIKAVTGATEQQMGLLEQQALDLGKSTVFSASEIAGANEELVKAGLSVEDALNGATAATVNLAAAGGIALEEAAKIASNVKNAFGLLAEEMPHVADILAGAANASAISVSELGQSMQQASAVAHLAGLSFEDTATAIAAMGNAGIKGSDAGTSLKTMLQNLQPVTARQSAEFERLGLITEDGTSKFFDAEGSVKSLAEISGVLGGALAGMTDAQKLASLEIIFGTDAIRAAAVVAGTGADGIRELAESMGEISAADVAAERMDNFRGKLEELRGATETFMITVGGPLLSVLAGVASGFADLINWVSELSGPVRTGAIVAGLLATALLLVAGATFLLIPRIHATNLALGKMAAAGSLTAKAMQGLTGALLGPLGLALAAATVALGIYAAKQQAAKASIDELRGTLDQETGAFTDNTRATIANRLEKDGLLKAAQTLGLNLDTVTSAVLGEADALAEVKAAIDAANPSNEDLARLVDEGATAYTDAGVAAVGLSGALGNLPPQLDAAQEAQKRVAEATGDTTSKIGDAIPGVEEYGESFSDVADELSDTEVAAGKVDDALKILDESMRRYFDITWGVDEAQDALQSSLNRLAEEINGAHDAAVEAGDATLEYDRTLGGLTQAGIDNEAVLRDMARGLAEVATEQIEAGESQKEVTDTYLAGRDALIEQLVQLGYNREAVEAMIAVEGNVLPLIETHFNTPGLAQATLDAKGLDDTVRAVPLTWETIFTTDDVAAKAKLLIYKQAVIDAAQDQTTVIHVEVDDPWDYLGGGGWQGGGPQGGRVAGPGGRGAAGATGGAQRGTGMAGLSGGAWMAGGSSWSVPVTQPRMGGSGVGGELASVLDRLAKGGAGGAAQRPGYSGPLVQVTTHNPVRESETDAVDYAMTLLVARGLVRPG